VYSETTVPGHAKSGTYDLDRHASARIRVSANPFDRDSDAAMTAPNVIEVPSVGVA
jgi:hypothetical protein